VRISNIMILLSLVVSLLMIDSAAFAKKKKRKRKHKQKQSEQMTTDMSESMGSGQTYAYGMAGCGLGSLIIKQNSMMGQVTAATLNGTGAQTSGISTGTSNCRVNHSMAQLEQEVFITANFASLSKDAAQGEGQHLRAFAEVLGCTDQLGDFARVSQQNYAEIFSVTDPKAALDNYRGVIISNEALSGTCNRARI